MSFNSNTFNSAPFNGVTVSSPGSVIASGSGAIAYLGQNVTIQGSGAIAYLEQDVELFIQGSGAIAYLAQNVISTGSGAIAYLAQNVTNQAERTKLQRWRHGVNVFLGGVELDPSILTGDLIVDKGEGESITCDLELIPGFGRQDPSDYFGKELIVIAENPTSGPYRIFTGVVDTTEFDVMTWRTSLRATNRRKELIGAIVGVDEKFGTQFDTSYLIDQELSTEDKVEELLKYAPKSLDFDSYNEYHYVDWEPKATADFVLASADVFRRKPTVEVVNRSRIINQVKLKVEYQYTRLHYVQVHYTWNAEFNSAGAGFDKVTQQGYSLTRKETIVAAIEGTGWPLRAGSLGFEDLPPPGWYGGIGWQGDVQQATTVANTDAGGSPLTDSNGNTVYRSVTKQAYKGTNGVHCTEAGFDLTYRFSQQGIKSYNLEVNALESQGYFGVISRESGYSITDTYDAERWNNNEAHVRFFDVGNGTTLTLDSSQTYEVTTQEGKARSNIQAAIAAAQVEILKSHRENIVTCEVALMPQLELHHTVEINSNVIESKGKVKRITHTISFDEYDSSTKIETAQYYLGSGGTTASTVPPTITPSNPAAFPGNRVLPSIYGVDPNLRLNYDGWYGNRYITGSLTKTAYTEQFRVDTPFIPGGLTNGIKFSNNTTSYSLEIPAATIGIIYAKTWQS